MEWGAVWGRRRVTSSREGYRKSLKPRESWWPCENAIKIIRLCHDSGTRDDSSPPARTILLSKIRSISSVPSDGRVTPFPPQQGCAPLAKITVLFFNIFTHEISIFLVSEKNSIRFEKINILYLFYLKMDNITRLKIFENRIDENVRVRHK